MDPDLLTGQLAAEVAVADELSLRLEVLAAVISYGSRHIVIDAATRDVAVLSARLQAAESERLVLSGGRTLSESIAALPVETRRGIEGAGREIRRAAGAVELAAVRARACLGARMGAVDDVLTALDVTIDYDERGNRRTRELTGFGARA